MVIYKVTNLVNNKVYIGQTIKDLKQRKAQHIAVSKKPHYAIARAIKKYGVHNFKWEVICICPNQKVLDEQEIYYIKIYGTVKNGYNATKGGLGGLPSEETRKILSKQAFEQWANPKIREKMLKNQKPPTGMKHTEAHKKRIGAMSKKRWQSPEYRDKVVSSIRKRWEDPVYRELYLKALKKGLKTRCLVIKYDNRTWNLKELSDHVGINYNTLYGRIFTQNLPIDVAVTKPVLVC